jgi:hypothetical protein
MNRNLGLGLTFLSLSLLSIADLSQPKFVHAATAPQVASLLQSLPRPSTASKTATTLFSANAYQQQSINFQAQLKPAAAVKFYQESLTAKGYQERAINTVKGDWVFNLVFNPPEELILSANNQEKP